MLPHDQLESALTYYYNSAHQLVFALPDTAYVYKVAPGPMIAGDRVTPNAWNYQVDKERGWGDGACDDFLSNGNFAGGLSGCAGSSSHLLPLGGWRRSEAYNKALDKLNDEIRGNLDLAVSVAEGISVGRGLVKGVADGVQLVRNLRRGGVSVEYLQGWLRQWTRDPTFRPRETARDTLRNAANGWLQFQYGWKPMMKDIFDSMDEYIRIILNRMKRCRSRATVEDRSIDNYTGQIWSQNGFKCTRAISTASRCEIGVSLSFPDFDLYRWTSLDPVTLVWELIPYSFVVDWFWNIGNYARNFETALLYGSRFHGGYVSESWLSDCEAYCPKQRVSTSFGWRDITGPLSAWRTRRRFERYVLTDYPYPRLPPLRRKGLGDLQTMSAISLAIQVLDRNSR